MDTFLKVQIFVEKWNDPNDCQTDENIKSNLKKQPRGNHVWLWYTRIPIHKRIRVSVCFSFNP